MNQEKELTTYRKKDLFGKISLLFFLGAYFVFIQVDMIWAGIVVSGLLALASSAYIIYNDYKHNEIARIKEKIIGGIATLVFAILTLIFTMYYFDMSLSVLF